MLTCTKHIFNEVPKYKRIIFQQWQTHCDSTEKIIEMLDEETLEVLSVNFVTFVQFKKREKHLEGAYSNVTKLSIGVFHVL